MGRVAPRSNPGSGLTLPSLRATGMRPAVRRLMELVVATKLMLSSDLHMIPEFCLKHMGCTALIIASAALE